MEFWGVEVKPGETVKCQPGDEKYIHLSQACLGETKKPIESVPLFVKCDDKKLVVGTLHGEKCAQIQYDLILKKEFELSHGSKNASVYFCGYKFIINKDAGDMFDDMSYESEEEEPIAYHFEAVPIEAPALNGLDKEEEYVDVVPSNMYENRMDMLANHAMNCAESISKELKTVMRAVESWKEQLKVAIERAARHG